MSVFAFVRRRTAIAALVFAVSASAAAMAAESEPSPFLGGFIKETRVVYPLRLGPWLAQGEHLYEYQELGASVRYKDERFKDRWIDVYFYPVGILPKDGLGQVAEQTAAELRMAAEQRGDLQGFEMDRLGAFTLALPAPKNGKSAEPLPAYSLSLRVPIKGTVYRSAMAITAYRMYLVKARYSIAQESEGATEVKAELDRFLGDIVRNTDIQSTGECWAPLPIVRKSPLEEGDGALVSIKTDDQGLRAVAYPDRVDALEPDSDEAKAMQLLGMSFAGRMTEGCGPQEDLNPVVPEGKREIRFEYRAPESNPSGPGLPRVGTETG